MPKQLMLYNPPDGWAAEKLAPLVDRFILTSKPEREQYARAMLKVNPNIEFHLYLLQHGGHLAAPDAPNNNQILNRKGEAEALLKQYPDIALHDATTGKVLLKNERQDYFVANTAHAIWRKLMVERVAEIKARAPFYSHLWFDDLGTESTFNYVGKKVVKEFPSTGLYFRHTCEYLIWARQNAALANGLRFGGNLQAPPERFAAWQEAAGILLTTGGNVLLEWGWFNWQGELTEDSWQNTFKKADFVTRNGGQLNVIMQRDPRKLADLKSQAYREFEFALYSQMLISNGEDGIRVANPYDYFADVPAIRGIDTLLGKPKGSYRREGDWYCRDFQNYGIAVNPKTCEHKRVEPPIIVVEPPKPPETVTLNISFQLTVPAAIAPVIQQAVDSMVIMAANAQTTPTTE